MNRPPSRGTLESDTTLARQNYNWALKLYTDWDYRQSKEETEAELDARREDENRLYDAQLRIERRKIARLYGPFAAEDPAPPFDPDSAHSAKEYLARLLAGAQAFLSLGVSDLA